MSNPRDNAFVNGYEARGADEPREANPYLAGDMRDAWFEGWDDLGSVLEFDYGGS